MTVQNVGCRISLLLLCAAACGGGTKELNGNGNRVTTREVGAEDTLYYLDLSKPTVEQPVDLKGVRTGTYKFVQIEVARVTNPKKLPLTFEVWYQPKDKDRMFLGSFSLYPADNPGKFIVPTQGKLNDGGAILVSLVTPSKAASGDTVGVAIKKITFLEG